MKKISVVFMLCLSMIIIGGCGGSSSKIAEKVLVTKRIETEYFQFDREYRSVSGVESSLVKKLYESNRNTQYAYVNDILKELDKTADKNIEKLNSLKQTIPQEIVSMDDVSGKLDYSLQIATLQKQLAQAVRNGDKEAFNEVYGEMITLEQRIKRFESYSDKYLSDKISDVKGEPRTRL